MSNLPESVLKNKSIAVTGKLETYANRDELKSIIIRNCGSLASSVTSGVDYLIMNNPNSDSSKSQKAREMGVEVITERQFNEIVGRIFLIEGAVLKQYCGTGGNVSIPEGVTEIGEEAFLSCETLTSVTIPQSVVCIGNSAFCDCERLAEVRLPESIAKIGKYAFYDCPELKRLTIPDMTKELGADFITAELGTRIYVSDIKRLAGSMRPNAVLCFAEDGGEKADVRYTGYIQYIKANCTILISLAMKYLAVLALMCRETLITPKSIESYVAAAQKSGSTEAVAMLLDYQANKVSEKEKEALIKQKEKEQSTVTERLLARQRRDGVEGLTIAVAGKMKVFTNRNALKGYLESKGAKLASSLTANVDCLVMNDPKTDIAKAHKAEELGIEIITEAKLMELTGWSFVREGNTLIRYRGIGDTAMIPDGVTSIQKEAFMGCTDLKSVLFPESVTEIGESAFYGCNSLTALLIPNSVTHIESRAFCACRGLTNLTVSAKLTRIESWSFSYCSSLTSVEIPNGVTSIGEFAFFGCEKLTSVFIPGSVVAIEADAFSDLYKLTIHAPAGSYAEQYAKENNIPFAAE